MTKNTIQAAKFFKKMLTKEKISDIYKLHSIEIFRYLYRLIMNTEATEDILQEVFEKFIIYTSEKNVQEEKIRAFLYKSAHNLAINYLIRQRRKSHDNIDDIEESLKTEDNNLENFLLDDLNKKIYKLLDRVKPDSRSMFIMHKEDGMTYEEIAEYLSISSRTVRRRVKDVTDMLFSELKKEGFL